jgi:thiamine pyrophosphate-dependent acetolactate synthase large subunit-like protein
VCVFSKRSAVHNARTKTLGRLRHCRAQAACGIFGRNVEDPEELEQALRAAFDYPGPALVSVRVTKHEISFPPTIDFEEANLFFGVPKVCFNPGVEARRH